MADTGSGSLPPPLAPAALQAGPTGEPQALQVGPATTMVPPAPVTMGVVTEGGATTTTSGGGSGVPSITPTAPAGGASGSGDSALPAAARVATPTGHAPHMVQAPPALSEADLEKLGREKEMVEKHERDVRGRLEQRMRKMQEEANKLRAIREELSSMTEPVRQDIQLIRDRIDRCERDLGYIKKRHAQKKAEYEQVDKELTDKTQEKALLVGHLNTIIREVTRNKESRLRELEQKLLDSPEGAGAGATAGPRPPSDPPVDTRDMFEGFT